MKLAKEIIIVLAVSIAIVFAATSIAEAAGPPRGSIGYCKKHAVNDLVKRKCYIRVVWKSEGRRVSDKAVRVAWCESRINPRVWSRGGHYYGTFQFGAPERKRFNYGHTVVSQARAALAYYKISGWRPWPSCGA
jgi:hypothetical protein